MMSIYNPAPTISLMEQSQAPDYTLRVMTLIDAIHRARDVPDLLELLHACTDTMGSTASIFLVAIPEDGAELTLQVLLACDPEFIYEHVQTCKLLEHPWIGYGRAHDLPIAASRLTYENVKQHAVVELARQHGFKSALIVPTPSAAGLGRFGVLCLGSAAVDDFDHDESHVVHLLARSLATALYDWFAVHSRESLQTSARLMTRDIKLLAMEMQGLSTKQIAKVLGISSRAVDSQFQRIKLRMACPTRRAAAKRAAAYGLLKAGNNGCGHAGKLQCSCPEDAQGQPPARSEPTAAKRGLNSSAESAAIASTLNSMVHSKAPNHRQRIGAVDQ